MCATVLLLTHIALGDMFLILGAASFLAFTQILNSERALFQF